MDLHSESSFFVLPAVHLALQYLLHWTLHANISTKFFCTSYDSRLCWLLSFYATFSGFILAGVHKVSKKQILLASFSHTIFFSWMGWNLVLWISKSSWTFSRCFWVRFLEFCLLVACLTSQQQVSVSQGRICSDNCMCCHTWDRSCRSNFLPHPVTVYWHWADQCQRWP